MATTTAPAATIVDNRAGDAASIGALKAFLRALGAAHAVEGRPTPGSPRAGGANRGHLPADDRVADRLRKARGRARAAGTATSCSPTPWTSTGGPGRGALPPSSRCARPPPEGLYGNSDAVSDYLRCLGLAGP